MNENIENESNERNESTIKTKAQQEVDVHDLVKWMRIELLTTFFWI